MNTTLMGLLPAQPNLNTPLTLRQANNTTPLAQMNQNLGEVSRICNIIGTTADSKNLPPEVLAVITAQISNNKVSQEGLAFVTPSPTGNDGSLVVFESVSHNHPDVAPHKHFYQSALVFNPKQQNLANETVEAYFENLPDNGLMAFYNAYCLDKTEGIRQILRSVGIDAKFGPNSTIDRFPDAYVKISSWQANRPKEDGKAVPNWLSLFISPSPMGGRKPRIDWFQEATAQNPPTKPLDENLKELHLWGTAGDTFLPSDFKTKGLLDVNTGIVTASKQNHVLELEGLLNRGVQGVHELTTYLKAIMR